MKIEIGDPILVYAPTMTEAVSKWGVYAIPRMWREPSGELVVRFNGEEDSADTENMQRVPNLYFVSYDNGESWSKSERGDEWYDISALTGIDPPYKKLSNGDTVYLKYGKDLPPIKNIAYTGEFVSPCGDAVLHTYKWGDIPKECRKIYFGRKTEDGKDELFLSDLDFPERELQIVAKAWDSHGFVPTDEYVQPCIFRLPYFSAICETKEKELVGLCVGQNPNVHDKSYTEVYLVASSDGGKIWRKRAVVAGGVSDLPYGYGGDGGEVSLAVDKDGVLYAVMRMDMSSNPDTDPHVYDTMFCRSFDSGYTWSKPTSVSDSSVTPHIVSLGDALVLIYGRPGVHIKYSFDKGDRWSEPYSIIGKTLEEERRLGRSDFESKYLKSYSYSNTFWERISDNEIIMLYNDLRYPDENGIETKAAFVRKIKFVD